jgi:hypothetical protein
MLGPEIEQMGSRTAKTIGASPVTLYLLTEDADKTVAKALKLGATQKGPVRDMFWGDRTGTIVDLDGNTWMIATHKAEPTPQEMKKKMEQVRAQSASSGSGSNRFAARAPIKSIAVLDQRRPWVRSVSCGSM